MAMIRQDFFCPDYRCFKIEELTGRKGAEIQKHDHHLIVYIDSDVPKHVIQMDVGAEKRELFESYPSFNDLIEAFLPPRPTATPSFPSNIPPGGQHHRNLHLSEDGSRSCVERLVKEANDKGGDNGTIAIEVLEAVGP